jgi:hypothetical protein
VTPITADAAARGPVILLLLQRLEGGRVMKGGNLLLQKNSFTSTSPEYQERTRVGKDPQAQLAYFISRTERTTPKSERKKIKLHQIYQMFEGLTDENDT